MTAEQQIEPGRYIDFNGLPVETSRFKRLTLSWGAAASVALGGLSIGVKGDAPAFVIPFTAVFAVISALPRRWCNKSLHEPLFPGCVVDTKPKEGQITSPQYQRGIHKAKQGTLVSAAGTAVIAAMSSGGYGVLFPIQLLQTHNVWCKIQSGRYAIVARDAMARAAPEPQNTP